MLILTRRVGETMIVGDDIAITILGVKGNQVRIGTEAPKHIDVHREEIYKRIKAERLEQEPNPKLTERLEQEPNPKLRLAKKTA